VLAPENEAGHDYTKQRSVGREKRAQIEGKLVKQSTSIL
jgi:hypothetical protein